MSVTSPRHQTGCALARQNQHRGLLDPGRPHRPLRLSRSSQRCEHTPSPSVPPPARSLPGQLVKAQQLRGTEQLHRLLSKRSARDRPGLRTALAHLPCPAHTGILHHEQLPAWVQSAMPGREVCDGSVEHASSAICQARASPTRQQQLEIPQNNRNQPVEVGPRELYANRVGVSAMHLTNAARGSPEWAAHSSQRPLPRGKPDFGSPCPQAQRKRKRSAAAPRPPGRATGNGQAQRLIMQRSSSCLGRGVPRGSRCGDWPGMRGEGWGRGGGGWILAVPCSEPPAVTSSPGGHCHSDLEPPPRSGQQIGRLPASPRPAQRPHDTVCAEKQSAEQGVACLCCHRSWRSGTLLPHSGWAPGAWRPGEGEHRGGF